MDGEYSMIVNGSSLFHLQPLSPMEDRKMVHTLNGRRMSYGLTECGYDIRLAQTVTLFLGRRFVLGSSLEEFNVPNNLMGRVLNKSTWARLGIDVSRSTNLEPGWKGFLTLEITYSRWWPITLPAGIGIAQVIFEEISEPAAYEGKYQNQRSGAVKAIV